MHATRWAQANSQASIVTFAVRSVRTMIGMAGCRASFVLATTIASGCYSGLHGGAQQSDETGSATTGASASASEGGSESSESGGPVDGDCDDVEAAAAVIRPLNRREYANTIRDLFALDDATVADLVADFPPDAIVGFDNHAESLVASDLLVEAQLYAAESIAATIDLASLLPCDPAADEDACATATIDAFGLRAFRRPLGTQEHDALAKVYADARAAGRDFDAAARLLVEAMLVSPQFLYRAETGVAPDEGAAQVDPFELAARLSYFLWSSMPDDELLQAAQDGTLVEPEQVEAHARRLLDDPRAHATIVEFHRQWLELQRLDQTVKDETLAPGFAELKPTLVAETLAFVEHIVWSDDDRIDRLLVSDEIMVNGELAAWYGIAGAFGAELEAVPATDERFGLLTQAGLLAQFSNTNRTSPTRRGAFVRRRLLCQPPPPPPPNVPALPTDVDENAPIRERLAQHVADPACSGCHAMIDPVGFGLEAYDLAGRHRTMDAGMPVDASGELSGVSVADTKFVGVRELSDLLVEADELEACAAREVFEFAMGRAPAAEDACALERLATAMHDNGGSVLELWVAVATSHAFGRRAMEVAP
jgi:uncharacterized protein DUF1592/uncharacterized protein DUF1588/uncharacterized protein DUF1595/uncharacterized protein DUF1587/uncharacterized protein DUF1585